MTIIKDITKALRSGRVTRWHQNPDMNHSNENNAAHQWSVAMWALFLDPQLSRSALIAALTHDVGELDAGDLSRPFKKAAPTLAAAHAKVEMSARAEITHVPTLTDRETTIIKIADSLAAWDAMCHYQPSLRHRDDWINQLDAIFTMIGAMFGDGVMRDVGLVIGGRHDELDQRRL